MAEHIDYSDPKYAEAAAAILERHNIGAAEANITSAIRDFLLLTKLVRSDQIDEETSPAEGSRGAVDLKALDTLIEVKRRIGNGIDPNPDYLNQVDGYLAAAAAQGRTPMGILTDGKHWLLRWPGAEQQPVKTAPPYAYTLEDAERWLPLYEWLRDQALYIHENVVPSRKAIAQRFGPDSPSYERDIATLRKLYNEYASFSTIRVKRQLWENLLMAALGEIAQSDAALDELFVRHTYLTAVVGMVVQASFGIDILDRAERDPADLLLGRYFRNTTGLQGVVDSDFFAWPKEVGGVPLLKTLARDVSRFNWQEAPTDIAAILYETVIPANERRQLGEYYTPDWLARTIVREVVTDPLNQTVLDPACGSGTFIAEAISHLIEAARKTPLEPKEVLDKLRFSVVGIDVHPVAVHLARTAWVMAARPALDNAKDWRTTSDLTVPIYLGDALQLRFRTEGMFAQHEVTVQVEDEQNTELVFPRRLVEQAESFDRLMGNIAESIERGRDPHIDLDDHGIRGPEERRTLERTVEKLRRLRRDGRDHIWAYYTRNLVRPVALAESKVNVIVGNPPWINYNQTIDILRKELVRQSKTVYSIWAGGRYATHQDVASLFFARCVDLYLKDGGHIGMVMPHSALQAGQHERWRTGTWIDRKSNNALSVDFSSKTPWNLEGLTPNTFFPIPASVVFAKRLGPATKGVPLAGNVEHWRGTPGSPDVQRVLTLTTDISKGGSPYAERSRQGATIVPRCLFYVEETENPATVQTSWTIAVKPRRGIHDKAPWKDLKLPAITDETVEAQHVYDVHLGETLAPYVTLDPLKAVLPMKRAEYEVPTDKDGVGGIRLGGLGRLMRGRWETISKAWEDNRAEANKLPLVDRLDYHGELSAQLTWQDDHGGRPIRVVYTSAGIPTAAILADDASIVDYKLFWIACKNLQEAHYLLAVINSDALYNAATPLMSKGLWGARDLQKHLWKLPIPVFDAKDPLRRQVARVGKAAAAGAASQFAMLREELGDLGVAVVRRELRSWLRGSKEGQAVERAVEKLLAG